jgi:hypothetical protein
MSFHLVFGEHGAGGVAGVGEQNGAGMLVDAGLHSLADGEFVALLRGGGDGVDGCAGETDEGVVVGIEGLRHDDLVAVVKDAGHEHLQGLAAAGGDKNVRW